MPVRATKSSRTAASLTMPRYSIPRGITWCKDPRASSLACLGMGRTPVRLSVDGRSPRIPSHVSRRCPVVRVQEEAAKELRGRKGHRLQAIPPRVLPPPEAHVPRLQTDQPVVGEGPPVLRVSEAQWVEGPRLGRELSRARPQILAALGDQRLPVRHPVVSREQRGEWGGLAAGAPEDAAGPPRAPKRRRASPPTPCGARQVNEGNNVPFHVSSPSSRAICVMV